ncbi:winged helix-turn-helix domain-containing protein [Belnapia sp. T18]|uniref:Winged helix-turn-helix domain-containing protein n=1 Tax=Belnapia arida TaxID=2804533 RepID=A0ABS1UD11_9PROT|nr:winged helix-turn-helix domain-containing protein [Belnapia arida]MBL6082579.1 winged helix-turn-helix domain-containing protein [Belnapia arida]
MTLDPARRELRQAGNLVSLEPQVFDLLEFLIRMRDRVVSRDDLMTEVWRGRIVSDATLSSRVNAARVAIGDNGAEQRLIRTLPRKGVRFVGAVAEAAETTPESLAGRARGAGEIRLPSVAVLPFANIGGDPEQDYFADGMAVEIITALTRSSGLLVIARNSSFAFKGQTVDIRQVGRELGVGYLLEGSVRRDGDRLRITGQLVDAVSGTHLWADRFEGDLHDIFALQDRVAESVVATIEPTLQRAEIERHRQERPKRLDAYDLLLQAFALEHEFTADSMTALRCLEQALAIEPDYAPAMAAAAYYHTQRHFQGWTPPEGAVRAKALRLADRAVELAPNDAQILWMAAFAVWNMAGEGREKARDLFSRSLLLNPNSAMALTLAGWIEIMCGNQGTGREMLARAQRLNPRDPRNWLISGAMAIAAVADQDFADAASWAKKALAQNPRFAVALRVLAVALVKLEQPERARRVVQELLAVEPELTISSFLTRIPLPVETMARTYAKALNAAGLPQ